MSEKLTALWVNHKPSGYDDKFDINGFASDLEQHSPRTKNGMWMCCFDLYVVAFWIAWKYPGRGFQVVRYLKLVGQYQLFHTAEAKNFWQYAEPSIVDHSKAVIVCTDNNHYNCVEERWCG